jgi:hypothetical protein
MKLNYRKVEFHVSPQTMVKRLDRQPWEKMLNNDERKNILKNAVVNFPLAKLKKIKEKGEDAFTLLKTYLEKKP